MTKYELTIDNFKKYNSKSILVGAIIGDKYGYDSRYFNELNEVKELLIKIDNYIYNIFSCKNIKILEVGDVVNRDIIDLLFYLNEILKIIDEILEMSFKKLEDKIDINMLVDYDYRYNKYTKREKYIDINKIEIGDIIEIEYNKDVFDKSYTITINEDYLNSCKENDKAIIDLIYNYDTDEFKIIDNKISFKIKRDLLKY